MGVVLPERVRLMMRFQKMDRQTKVIDPITVKEMTIVQFMELAPIRSLISLKIVAERLPND